MNACDPRPWLLMSGPALVVVAAVAEAVFFTLFGEPFAGTRASAYTLGFFLFWLFGAVSSGFTCFLSAEVNNICPLEPTSRPPGCPKRVDDGIGR